MPQVDTPPPTLFDGRVPGQRLADGTAQYDLEPLLEVPFGERQKTKYHLFLQQHRSTLRISTLVEKKIPNLGRPRQIWKHQISYTVSTKRNQDGNATLNLYAYSKRRGLLNLTSRPELVYRTLTPLFQTILHEEAKRLFIQNIRPWRSPAQALPTLSDELLYNVYPAYFLYPGTMDQDRRVLHKRLPASLMPLLRARDSETLVTTMFGEGAPPELFTIFESGAPWQLFLAGHLFGRLVDPNLFVGLQWERSAIHYEKEEIAHLRMILNRCSPQVQLRLFEDYYRRTSSQAVQQQQPLLGLTNLCKNAKKRYPRDFPYRTIPKITETQNFSDLLSVIETVMGEEIKKSEAVIQTGFDQVLTKFHDLFNVVGKAEEGFQTTAEEIALVFFRNDKHWTTSNTIIHKSDGLTAAARFSPRFFGDNAPLPANSSLQKMLKNVTGYGSQEHPANDIMLSFEQAAAYLDELAAGLRRLAIRHQLDPNKENITQLLFLHLYYYDLFPTRSITNRRLKPPPVPAVLYDYAVAADLSPAAIRFGLKWSLPPATMRTYQVLPANLFNELDHIIPKVHGDQQTDDF